ncbi:hypothetical protein FB567DRAFT_235494 [Paraphoma chrysanthemicola]|uniref:Extracellular membrane protein CFEM domain-containing protein n=1 Tax=Paraphoma chrysanthemicola TaxID=798071 RepID=A0A8K0W2Q9_9PLEO|nr:hypothetical protein FB567DRAFT_235494 [Paraphoma chrysanthemicola]
MQLKNAFAWDNHIHINFMRSASALGKQVSSRIGPFLLEDFKAPGLSCFEPIVFPPLQLQAPPSAASNPPRAIETDRSQPCKRSKMYRLSNDAWNVLFLVLLTLGQQTRANIISDSDLARQRDCVRLCFGYNFQVPIWGAIGCPDDDSCMCRPDLRPSASSRLSYCILTQYKTCSDGTDIAMATSIFNRYCSFTGPATVIVTPTPTNAGQSFGGPVTVTAAVRTVFTSAPTVTVLSSRPQSSGTSLHVANAPAEWFLVMATLTTALSVLALRTWV